jgi:hypothetical protein
MEIHVGGLEEHVGELKEQVVELKRKSLLLRILSRATYAGMGKEVAFKELDPDKIFAQAEDSQVEACWAACGDLIKILEKFEAGVEAMSVPEREAWLQKNVFIPLLAAIDNTLSRVANVRHYKIHGNNIHVKHFHNGTFSIPDALLTRAEQFVARHPGSIYASRIRSECLRGGSDKP